MHHQLRVEMEKCACCHCGELAHVEVASAQGVVWWVPSGGMDIGIPTATMMSEDAAQKIQQLIFSFSFCPVLLLLSSGSISLQLHQSCLHLQLLLH